MSNFPSLQPALTAEIALGQPWGVGNVSNGAPMTCVPVVSGTLKSVEGGVLSGLIDAECVNGLDISRADPSFEHTRLEVNSVWRNKDDSFIYLSYKTLIRLTEQMKAVFTGSPEAKSTEFGSLLTTFRFETGNSKLKALEEHVFVASGRMVVEAGTPLRAEKVEGAGKDYHAVQGFLFYYETYFSSNF